MECADTSALLKAVQQSRDSRTPKRKRRQRVTISFGSFSIAACLNLLSELKDDFATAFALRGMREGHFHFAQRVSFFDFRL